MAKKQKEEQQGSSRFLKAANNIVRKRCMKAQNIYRFLSAIQSMGINECVMVVVANGVCLSSGNTVLAILFSP